MLVAVPAGDEGAAPLGYAVLGLEPSMASWDVVGSWTVGVVEANEGATRLYERAGFRPCCRSLMARLRPRE